ncbi:creatininase family protein [Micromonospora sp. AMSO12t]|nr:creatininase family protein [Micromonospora sp. AMSO12t]
MDGVSAAWPTGGGLVPAARIPGGELAAVAEAADFAVLPVGAVEWHGPHLPLGTDLILAEGFAAESAISGGDGAAAPGDGGATPAGDRATAAGPRGVLFPAVPYAACPGQTRPWPGTVSIRPEIAVGYLADVIEGIVAAGFPRLLIVNGHDANMSTVRAAMEWVSGRRTASLLLVNWFQLVTPAETAELYGPLPARGHGGAYETSGVLGFDPDAVRLDAVADLPPKPKLPVTHPYVLVESRPDPWQGWSGHISLAGEEAGRRVRQLAGTRLREVVAAWVAAPPPAPPTDAPLPTEVAPAADAPPTAPAGGPELEEAP